MKYKKILLLMVLLLPLISVTNVRADVTIPPESLETGNTAFFLCAVNQSQTLEVNLTHTGIGNFEMFLLSKRPSGTDIEAYFLVDSDTGDNPKLSYTAPEDKIYYVQINLVSSGPDIFTLSSTHNLIRYYLPQIPGFPLELVFVFLLSGVGLVYVLYKRKIKEL
jgi:hypothetical protein